MLATYKRSLVNAGLGEMRAYVIMINFVDVPLVYSATVCLSDYDDLRETMDSLRKTIVAVESGKPVKTHPHTDFLRSIIYDLATAKIVYDFGVGNTSLTYTQTGTGAILAGLRSWSDACSAVHSAFESIQQGPEQQRVLYEYPDIEGYAAAFPEDGILTP